MIEIKKILKKDIPQLLNDSDFWHNEFLSVSKHRLYAHYKNPNLEANDIVLLLSYFNDELVGYMGLYIDKINISGTIEKIGWLSTWWVHPKTKGTGIGRELLVTMYNETNGKIGISQFTPSAKRVYDKSGYFTTLKENQGLKAVLRSNLSFVIPVLFPKTTKLSFIFNKIDHLLNIFINLKLFFQKFSIERNLKKVTLEYVNIVDNEILHIINRHNKNDVSPKGKEFFEWLKAYHWIQKAPLLKYTNKSKYQFSIYDKEFDYFFIKIILDDKCIGFIVLQKRNYVTKLLFSYFDTSKHSNIISNIIKLQAINQNSREIICYENSICNEFRKSRVFLYRTKKLKQSILSKAFGKTNFEDIRLNFGDGDCSFA